MMLIRKEFEEFEEFKEFKELQERRGSQNPGSAGSGGRQWAIPQSSLKRIISKQWSDGRDLTVQILIKILITEH
jgi:hypothetical protein